MEKQNRKNKGNKLATIIVLVIVFVSIYIALISVHSWASKLWLTNRMEHGRCLANIADNYCKNTGYYDGVYKSSYYEFICIKNSNRELSENKAFTLNEMENCK